MFKCLVEFLKDERGGVTTTELIGYMLLLGGATTMIGYGIAAAMRGLAGKNVQTIKCADPAYASDPNCP